MKDSSLTTPFTRLVAGPARAAFGVGVVLLGGRLLSFLAGITLARWLGAAQFGAYGWLLSWVAILTTVSVFGFDLLLLRDVAMYDARGDPSALGALRRLATRTALVIGITLASIAALVLPALARHAAGVTVAACMLAGLTIGVGAQVRVRQSVLRGLQRPVVGQLGEAVVHPAVLLVLALIAVRAAAPSAGLALSLNAAGALAALLCPTWLLSRAHRPLGAGATKEQVRLWLRGAARMLLLTLLIALHGRMDILLLGALAGVGTVGPYAAAVSGASLAPIALNMVVGAMAPVFAAYAMTGQHDALRRIAMRATRISLLGGAPVALAMMLFGRYFLALYGAGFGGARTALTVLSIGQLVNVAAGPVSTLLTMAGHERDALLGLGAATVGHALLCVLLIPRWGMTGAAVASATAMCAWNIILWVFVRRRLDITLTPLGS